jgi:serine/threonine protein kinase
MANHYTLNTLLTKGDHIYRNSDTHVDVFLIQGKAVKVSDQSLQREAYFQRRAHSILGKSVPKLLAEYNSGVKYFLVQEYIHDSELLHDLQYYNHPTKSYPLSHSFDLHDVKKSFSVSRIMAVKLIKSGIYHGDLHTANILIKKNQLTKHITPYMIDFGRSVDMDMKYCIYLYQCFKFMVFDKLGITLDVVSDILLNRLTKPYDPPDIENVVIILAYLSNFMMYSYSCKNVGCFSNFLTLWFDYPWDQSVHGITCIEDGIVDIDIEVFRNACRKSFDIRTCMPYTSKKTKRSPRSL